MRWTEAKAKLCVNLSLIRLDILGFTDEMRCKGNVLAINVFYLYLLSLLMLYREGSTDLIARCAS